MNKSKSSSDIANEFVNQFLTQYLKNGMGSMSKADIDALVMYMLDNYTSKSGSNLQQLSNQTVSELLRAPVTKIKKLRYEAGLKYGERVEDEAKKRFISILSNAVFDIDSGKINLIVEDSLAKNWLQGQLKAHGQYFEHTFNTEVVSIQPDGFFRVLQILLPDQDVEDFKSKFEGLMQEKNRAKIVKAFAEIAKSFAKGAFSKLGALAVASSIPLPI